MSKSGTQFIFQIFMATAETFQQEKNGEPLWILQCTTKFTTWPHYKKRIWWRNYACLPFEHGFKSVDATFFIA